MTDFKAIYFDSAPVIYYLDKILPYKDIVKSIISDGLHNNARFVSSTILTI